MKYAFLFFFLPIFVFKSKGQSKEKLPLDSLSEREIIGNIYPVFYFTPETRYAFGVKLLQMRKQNGSYATDRPTLYLPTLVYTTQKQILTSFLVDVWRNHNKKHLQSQVEYNDFPYIFFGVGNNTQEEDKEDYTSRTVNFYAQYEHRFFHKVYLGARFDYKRETLPNVTQGGKLNQGNILGSNSTIASGLGPVLTLDSRDNIFSPSRGNYHQASAIFYQTFLGSKNNFSRYRIDLRRFKTVGPGVFAAQSFFTIATGTIPFQFLTPLGGVNVMRGLLEGRYRDENAAVVQADYRFPLFWRIGAAVFGGTGQVRPQLKDFTFNGFHMTGGGGLRYKLNAEGMLVRGDVAMSREGVYLYFAFSEAF